MSVSTKGLRKVNYKGQQYLWYVSEEKPRLPEMGFVGAAVPPEPVERVLHVISSNKKLIVHYHLPQAGDEVAYLRVEGPLFPRQPAAKEAVVPRWRHDLNRYPTADFVRRLIHWCMGGEGTG
ncbi:MAG: hypothetical protein OT477_22550 [Chloroflexi bacterium]|nr:hypothetical protein [Chloroflexota bacterium]